MLHLNDRHLSLAACLGLAVILTSCKKELDTPPERSLPIGQVMTIAELRALFTGTPVHFPEARSVYAVVTADERNGNLYKNIFVQDATGGIVLRLLNSGGLYQGDSIRIYLPGTVLSTYSGMLQIDSVDVDNNTVKQATGISIAPQLVTVAQITTALQGILIQMDSVEFIQGEMGLTYSDALGQTNVNRTLEDCTQSQVIVRTSGYSQFAAQVLPTGRGRFTAVVGQFNSTMQLYIRNINEVQLNGPRCNGSSGGPCPPVASVMTDFAGVVQYDPIDLSCWKNIATTGPVKWEGGTFSGNGFARCEAYGSGAASVVAWLVSPPVNYTSGMTLSFLSEMAYWTPGASDPFAVLISTDFDGTNVTGATWTPITATHAISTDANYTWKPSGAIDLGAYLPSGYTGSFSIAFRYSGGDPSNTTRYDIDDVIVQ